MSQFDALRARIANAKLKTIVVTPPANRKPAQGTKIFALSPARSSQPR